jgi:hypothetical protein
LANWVTGRQQLEFRLVGGVRWSDLSDSEVRSTRPGPAAAAPTSNGPPLRCCGCSAPVGAYIHYNGGLAQLILIKNIEETQYTLIRLR